MYECILWHYLPTALRESVDLCFALLAMRPRFALQLRAAAANMNRTIKIEEAISISSSYALQFPAA